MFILLIFSLPSPISRAKVVRDSEVGVNEGDTLKWTAKYYNGTLIITITIHIDEINLTGGNLVVFGDFSFYTYEHYNLEILTWNFTTKYINYGIQASYSAPWVGIYLLPSPLNTTLLTTYLLSYGFTSCDVSENTITAIYNCEEFVITYKDNGILYQSTTDTLIVKLDTTSDSISFSFSFYLIIPLSIGVLIYRKWKLIK